MKYITGKQQMINNLMMQRHRTLAVIGRIVEETCVDVSNDAKAGHNGNMAHANNRYRNRTSNLTNSITPELIEVNMKEVHGIVSAIMEYAMFVEFGTASNVRTGLPNKAYPFMVPALLENRDMFREKLTNILK